MFHNTSFWAWFCFSMFPKSAKGLLNFARTVAIRSCFLYKPSGYCVRTHIPKPTLKDCNTRYKSQPSYATTPNMKRTQTNCTQQQTRGATLFDQTTKLNTYSKNQILIHKILLMNRQTTNLIGLLEQMLLVFKAQLFDLQLKAHNQHRKIMQFPVQG